MTGNTLDPLVSTEAITKEDGRPTEYFLRKWLEQRGINEDTEGFGVAIVALEAAVAAIQGIDLIAGVGLAGGGDLSNGNRTFDLEDTAVTPDDYTSADITVDAQGRITAAANGAGGGGGSTTQLLHVQDQKAANTAGGGNTAATTHIRTLNTVVTNTLTGSSLSTNQVTLPAGTYDIIGTAPGFDVNRHRAFLYNTTDSVIAVLGRSEFTSASRFVSTLAAFQGRIVLTATKVFEVRHYTETAQPSNGLGVETNNGSVEVYTDLYIQQVIGTTGGAVALNDIDDVTVPAPANEDFLQWDTGTLKWINFGLFGAANTWSADQLFATADKSSIRLRSANSSEAVLRIQNSTTGFADTNGLFVGINSSEDTFIYNFHNNPINFGTNNAVRMVLSAGGDLDVTTGALTVGSTTDATSTTAAAIQTDGGIAAAKKIIAGEGIYLGGVVAANLLDDYEEGTFTPILRFGGASVGITYSVQVGEYTKIGNRVGFVIILIVSNNGSSTGAATITGLPFTVGTATALANRMQNMTGVTGQTQFLTTAATADIGSMEFLGTGTATSLTETNIPNNSVLIISGEYYV